MDNTIPKLTEINPDISFALPDIQLDHERDLSVLKLQYRGSQERDLLAPIIGRPLPVNGQSIALGGGLSCAWLAPGEWILMGAKDVVIALAAQVEDSLRDQLFLITDLTHARTSFRLNGSAARDRIASACPIDLRDASFPIGAAARSLLAKMPMFITRLCDQDRSCAYRIIVDQLAARYAARLLYPLAGRSRVHD